MIEIKKIQRAEIKALRDEQSADERQRRSLDIGNRLFSLTEFRDASSIAFYDSTMKEVDTNTMIDISLGMGKMISLPNVSLRDKSMSFYRIKDRSDMKRGAFGILEPKEDEEFITTPDRINMIIVPGLAFDKSCNRLGYGKGYYDDFLRGRSWLKKIGIAFNFQIVPQITPSKNDVQMDIIITDSNTIRNVSHM